MDEIGASCEEVGEFCRHLQGQARLPCSAGACKRHQMHILTAQELSDGSHFLLPSNERRGLSGQIVWMGTERIERRGISWEGRHGEPVEGARGLYVPQGMALDIPAGRSAPASVPLPTPRLLR